MPSSVTATTRVYGLIGHPVSHSFSPAMHNAAFQELGLDSIYGAFDVTPERLEEALRGVCGLNLGGLNVTVPHKSNVIPYLDNLDPWRKPSVPSTPSSTKTDACVAPAPTLQVF